MSTRSLLLPLFCLLLISNANAVVQVVSDGTATDRTADLQAAIDTAYANGDMVEIVGRVYVEDHIYLYGNVSLVGVGTLLLNDNPTYGSYWIVTGGKHYGSTGGDVVPWTGKIEGLTIKCTSLVTANVNLINLCVTDGGAIKDCNFDLRYSPAKIGGIVGLNNANFVNGGSFLRKNVKIRGNVMLAKQKSGGLNAIQLTFCSTAWISDNYIEGFGNDGIVLSDTTDFTISENNIQTPKGRIWLSSCQRGVVRGNIIKRVPDYDGVTTSNGGMIWVSLDNASAPSPSDITIENNCIVHATALNTTTQGIYVAGARRCKILNNIILDSSGYGRAIRVTPQQKTGWSDPENLEADNISRVRHVEVIGNTAASPLASGTCNGTMEEYSTSALGNAAGVPGPCIWAGNRAGVGGVTTIGRDTVRGYLD